MQDLQQKYVERIWGYYFVLDTIRLSDDMAALTKRLHIKQGQEISYQRHKYRKEVWTIAAGEGIFVSEGKEYSVKAGDVLRIDRNELHSIKAHSELVIIEVQLGYPLMEEDIERFDYVWKS